MADLPRRLPAQAASRGGVGRGRRGFVERLGFGGHLHAPARDLRLDGRRLGRDTGPLLARQRFVVALLRGDAGRAASRLPGDLPRPAGFRGFADEAAGRDAGPRGLLRRPALAGGDAGARRRPPRRLVGRRYGRHAVRHRPPGRRGIDRSGQPHVPLRFRGDEGRFGASVLAGPRRLRRRNGQPGVRPAPDRGRPRRRRSELAPQRDEQLLLQAAFQGRPRARGGLPLLGPLDADRRGQLSRRPDGLRQLARRGPRYAGHEQRHLPRGTATSLVSRP